MGQAQEQAIEFKPYVSCGSCTACCESLVIATWESPAVNKLPGNLCHHCVPNSKRPCSIYAERPRVCSSYECEFKTQRMPPRLRPDRAGFIVDRARAWGGDWVLNITVLEEHWDCDQFLAERGELVNQALAEIEGSEHMSVMVTARRDRRYLRSQGSATPAQLDQRAAEERRRLAELFGTDDQDHIDFVITLLSSPTPQGRSVMEQVGDPSKLDPALLNLMLDYARAAGRKPKKARSAQR